MLLLMGPTDAGKTTLAQELLAKAKEAYLLDLDPGQGALPGTFSLFLHREGRLLLVRRTLLGTLSPAGAEAKALVAALRLSTPPRQKPRWGPQKNLPKPYFGQTVLRNQRAAT